ncbi:MAG: rhamnosyltransferase [Chlamydiales bacterium]|jgi:rhamnosyltransferase
MSLPLASILIPTLDGESDLERLLPALAAQDFPGGFEVRAVDSASRDTTRQLLRRHGVHLSSISRSEFGHGKTRNTLARGARGRFLVFLSQDALPRDEHFLRHLLAPFSADAVAGVQARILPHPDQDPLTARTALDLPEASASLAAGTTQNDLGINNVASAMRATVFAEHPFLELPFGEDWAWARSVVAAGLELAFAPEAVVYHAHDYQPGQAFRRYELDARFQRHVRGQRVRPGLGSVLTGIAHELREDARYLRRVGAPLVHLLRAPGLRSAQVFGQYVGSHAWPWRHDASEFPEELPQS